MYIGIFNLKSPKVVYIDIDVCRWDLYRLGVNLIYILK